MTLARRRLLHRRVAAVLGRREQIRRWSPTTVAGGREAEAAQLYRIAGDRARSLYANAEALGHYRAALALGHPAQAELHQAIGDLETLAGDYGAALAGYEAAAALADPGLAARVEHRIGSLHLRRGAWELAEAPTARGAGGWCGGRARQADRSLAAHRRGLQARSPPSSPSFVRLAEAVGDRAASAQAQNILGVLAGDRAPCAAAWSWRRRAPTAAPGRRAQQPRARGRRRG